MRFFYEALKRHLERLTPPISFHALQFKAEIQAGIFSSWKKERGEKYARTPSDAELEKLAAVPELGLSLDRLRAWRAIDEYGIEVIRHAYEYMKDGLERNPTNEEMVELLSCTVRKEES